MSGRRPRAKRGRAPVSTEHHRRLENPFEPMRVLSDDHVAHIHDSAVRYLADEGLRVLLPEAREIYRAGGATVNDDEMIVRLDPESVASAVASSPASFEIHAANAERTVHVGGRSVALVPVGGPPFASDRRGGRRDGTLADQENFLRLTQSFDVLASTSPCVEPSDIAISDRHLRSGFATLTLTDKVPFLYARGRDRVRDVFEMVKLRHGIEADDEFAEMPRCWTNINVNSPRQLDVPMAMAIIDFARTGQACIMTPFTLAGAMAPVTLAGALVLQHMEALASITLAQLAKPSAPVLYGAFTSNVDMKSGSPAFGTPEAVKGAFASGQLARHIDIPWRSSGSSASNAVDAQGGYETMMNTFGALFGGANWIQHAAGWQEGGLTASFEKFIVDVEMCQMIAEMFKPIAVDDAALALDAITDVGPGGHFFGTEHTLERFETAFYAPIVFSRANFEQWTEEGSEPADVRATRVCDETLARYEPPPIPDEAKLALEDFVERRVREGGAAPD
ncbi:MAG: trimethylamine methyltransferase family protein [Acidimicrobiales bacterium]|nr:trimethylamine methyltransferase family protein [Acidimicrobiales bacterium]